MSKFVDYLKKEYAEDHEGEITRLREENEKLREALKPFADFYYNSRPCTDDAVICEADDGDEFNIEHGHLRKAYQVLRKNNG